MRTVGVRRAALATDQAMPGAPPNGLSVPAGHDHERARNAGPRLSIRRKTFSLAPSFWSGLSNPTKSLARPPAVSSAPAERRTWAARREQNPAATWIKGMPNFALRAAIALAHEVPGGNFVVVGINEGEVGWLAQNSCFSSPCTLRSNRRIPMESRHVDMLIASGTISTPPIASRP